MMLLLKKQSTVEDIQQSFIFNFPYLSIRFYKMEYLPHLHKTTLKEILGGLIVQSGFQKDSHLIDISGNRTVAQLEVDFITEGIQVKVFRKSGPSAIEIVLTREWTLARQNEEARLMDQIIASHQE